jgi:hypothetical protein
MAFQNIIFKEYLNLLYKSGQNYEITPFLMVFVNVHIHFRIWTQIWMRNPRFTDPVPDLAKVLDPCGSGSGSGSTPLTDGLYQYRIVLYRVAKPRHPGLAKTRVFKKNPSPVVFFWFFGFFLNFRLLQTYFCLYLVAIISLLAKTKYINYQSIVFASRNFLNLSILNLKPIGSLLLCGAKSWFRLFIITRGMAC